MPQFSFHKKQDTLSLAQALIGCELLCETENGVAAGIIVETEAYLKDDPACHAYNKKTARNAPMFEAAGHIYIYHIYGMYQCFNIVSGKQDEGEAVLIRALEPTQGLELMMQRRATKKQNLATKDLCSGPSKLVQALGINIEVHNNKPINACEISLLARTKATVEIVQTTRIGIVKGKELPYRFYLKGSEYISKK